MRMSETNNQPCFLIPTNIKIHSVHLEINTSFLGLSLINLFNDLKSCSGGGLSVFLALFDTVCFYFDVLTSVSASELSS